MRIGDVEVKKILPRDSIDCSNGCEAKAVAYYNGTPYCAVCLKAEQQLKWDAEGHFFEDYTGERYYAVGEPIVAAEPTPHHPSKSSKE